MFFNIVASAPRAHTLGIKHQGQLSPLFRVGHNTKKRLRPPHHQICGVDAWNLRAKTALHLRCTISHTNVADSG